MRRQKVAEMGDGVTQDAAVEAVYPPPTTPEQDLETRRARRRAALAPLLGMWKDDPSKQQDGVAFQKEMREEW